MRLFLIFMPLLITTNAQANAKRIDQDRASTELSSSDGRNSKPGGCGWGNSDQMAYNQKHGVTLKLGPPGAQNGHTNPLGIPPGIQDIEFTYLHRCGLEANVGIIPGVTSGLRYRTGSVLYGSVGGGLLLDANGIGPGLYSAIGASIVRSWPVTIEMEFKQAIGIGFGYGKTNLIFPYAFRLGAGFYW